MDGDVKGLTMQNKPQLTAEMEKRFNEQFAHLSVLIDQALSYTYVDSKNMGELKIKDIKHFLATALEEQRAMFVEEVRNRRATIKWLWGKQKTDDECFLMVMEQVQRIAEFAKLNQLKGNHE